jgi:hypothetical protein
MKIKLRAYSATKAMKKCILAIILVGLIYVTLMLLEDQILCSADQFTTNIPYGTQDLGSGSNINPNRFATLTSSNILGENLPRILFRQTYEGGSRVCIESPRFGSTGALIVRFQPEKGGDCDFPSKEEIMRHMMDSKGIITNSNGWVWEGTSIKDITNCVDDQNCLRYHIMMDKYCRMFDSMLNFYEKCFNDSPENSLNGNHSIKLLHVVKTVDYKNIHPTMFQNYLDKMMVTTMEASISIQKKIHLPDLKPDVLNYHSNMAHLSYKIPNINIPTSTKRNKKYNYINMKARTREYFGTFKCRKDTLCPLKEKNIEINPSEVMNVTLLRISIHFL